MATDTKGYRFVVTHTPMVEAQAAYAARYTQDDWRINSEARCFQASMRGLAVWAVQYLPEMQPTIYLTQEFASALGLCHCGAAATFVGFEGIRCSAHQKFGMSMLCSTPDCTRVSETGFSSFCSLHTTPKMRECRELYQAKLRAEEAARGNRWW